MLSKSPKRPKITKKPEANIPSPYLYVGADYKDFEGFVMDLIPTLRKLGIYCVDDPSCEGSDSYGIVLSPVPINPISLAKDLCEFAGEPNNRELLNTYINSYKPHDPLYVKGETVVYKGGDNSVDLSQIYQVVSAEYDTKAGTWIYSLKGKIDPIIEAKLVLVKP